MLQKIEFDKMQGLGNDYVYLTCLETVPLGLSSLAKDISDRHFGVGGDGLVVITRSDCADFRMIMFNADGSEAQMCGNASRCIGKLVFDSGLTRNTSISLETKAGVKPLHLNILHGRVESVTVNMGKPFLKKDDIPVMHDETNEFPILKRICLGKRTFDVYCVGMGNPHGVIFENLSDEEFAYYGPLLESHPVWPEKANIEFVSVLDKHNVSMRVWERGTGETLACGTGACASAVAAVMTGQTANDVNVVMKGGSLNIRLDDNSDVLMTGPAEHVAHGFYFWKTPMTVI